MSERIPLRKGSLVVFMGTMNAMPMMYAVELRNHGCEVLYIVDVPRENILSRPENHFSEIKYPYPPWIKELVLPTQVLLPLFPKLCATFYRWWVRRHAGKNVDCYVLNGFFTSLAPYLPAASKKVALSHGADLDTWANRGSAESLVPGYRERSVFKYLPRKTLRPLLERMLTTQFLGYASADALVYFPIGFSGQGDRIVRELQALGVRHVPRYDISFEPLRDQPRGFKGPTQKIEIFVGVRFLYKTFAEGNTEYNKGNDVIIRGIAKYVARNPMVKIHFVEKGEDVHHAKALCRELGLERYVVWHPEMPFRELLELFRRADICFDQVGDHWIGAIGFYALWLGKPLIANVERAVRSGAWPADNPICSAKTAEAIAEWLARLEDRSFREQVSSQSKLFAEAYVGPSKALTSIFDLG